jgi:spore germination protein KA
MKSNDDKNKKKRDKQRVKSPYKPHKSSQEITINESNLSQQDEDKNTNDPQTMEDSSVEQDSTDSKVEDKGNGSQTTSNETKENKDSKVISQKEETNNKQNNEQVKTESEEAKKAEKKKTEPISASLDTNIRHVKEKTGDSQDIVIREIHFGIDKKLSACLFFTEGLTDTTGLQHFVLEPLMIFLKEKDWKTFDISPDSWLPFIERSLLPIGGVSQIENFEELFTFLLSGEVIFLMQGCKIGYRISLKSWKDRGIPEAEGVVRGPRETFSETMRTNTALLRRKINNPRLRLEGKTIGEITKTQISMMFIDGLVDKKVLDEVRRRLDRIDIDGILESGYIEELIQDEAYSPFPTIHHTQKPDVVAAALLEGRVAIIVDGTPFVLIVPALFNQFFQAAEDYYERSLISSLIRILRFVCLFISLLAPAVYVAVTTFHQEMLPTPLLVNLMVQREAVPFPAFVEAFLMELVFEILREAGVRLPKAVGQTVSFVGALVVGQAAVEAGIVSAGMVIVVAITAISSFVIPAYNMSIALRILRFILMMIAAGFGLYGVIIGIIVIVLHLCSIRSFGIPYMTPYGPYISSEFKDSIVRLPHWMMSKRPTSLVSNDVIRGNNPPPTKPNKKGKNEK